MTDAFGAMIAQSRVKTFSIVGATGVEGILRLRLRMTDAF
jgi:hypothetical protein